MHTILVVDDDDSIRDLLEIILGRLYHVITADGVGAATAALDTYENIDLILTDYHMDDGVGTDLCGQEVPVFLMSAGFDPDLAKDLLQSGDIAGFIPKPFDKFHLFIGIEDILSPRNNPYDFF